MDSSQERRKKDQSLLTAVRILSRHLKILFQRVTATGAGRGGIAVWGPGTGDDFAAATGFSPVCLTDVVVMAPTGFFTNAILGGASLEAIFFCLVALAFLAVIFFGFEDLAFFFLSP